HGEWVSCKGRLEFDQCSNRHTERRPQSFRWFVRRRYKSIARGRNHKTHKRQKKSRLEDQFSTDFFVPLVRLVVSSPPIHIHLARRSVSNTEYSRRFDGCFRSDRQCKSHRLHLLQTTKSPAEFVGVR